LESGHLVRRRWKDSNEVSLIETDVRIRHEVNVLYYYKFSTTDNKKQKY
jgi:hypothetical protein